MAEFVQWSDAISVGIQEIDEQHKRLVALLNELFDVMVTDSPDRDSVARKTLEELFDYTAVHFAVEESLFRIFDYPGYEYHKQKHDLLKSELAEISKRIQAGEKRIDSTLLIFMKNWITGHITNEDKSYSPYLLQQGVKKSWAKKSWLDKFFG